MRRSRHQPPPIEQFNLFDSTMPLRNEDAVDGLPASIQELVDLIGLNATIDLVKCCGGDVLNIPEHIDSGRVWALLVEQVGRGNALKIVERYRKTELYIAKCEYHLRNRRAQGYVDRIMQGEPFSNVRQESGLTRRHLQNLLAARRKRPG